MGRKKTPNQKEKDDFLSSSLNKGERKDIDQLVIDKANLDFANPDDHPEMVEFSRTMIEILAEEDARWNLFAPDDYTVESHRFK